MNYKILWWSIQGKVQFLLLNLCFLLIWRLIEIMFVRRRSSRSFLLIFFSVTSRKIYLLKLRLGLLAFLLILISTKGQDFWRKCRKFFRSMELEPKMSLKIHCFQGQGIDRMEKKEHFNIRWRRWTRKDIQSQPRKKFLAVLKRKTLFKNKIWETIQTGLWLTSHKVVKKQMKDSITGIFSHVL